ncbi:formylglycine-generating enzyme family protein [Aquimarina sediminis]|uniref:formylglycine-generating enzyme family protein n=1 Tax=Aquimarina sediminis TaxID=2070536 RepID=UPI0019D4E134|nr:SUMF1/EgtB/PvdO family nonheme iron enzyme [Aquimarina sediminis]
METIRDKIDKEVIDELLVTIPAGTVDMRDDRINKTWSVNIDSFKLCKYPVTQEIYKVITNKNPSTFNGHKLPVETVSWNNAVAFCNASLNL